MAGGSDRGGHAAAALRLVADIPPVWRHPPLLLPLGRRGRAGARTGAAAARDGANGRRALGCDCDPGAAAVHGGYAPGRAACRLVRRCGPHPLLRRV